MRYVWSLCFCLSTALAAVSADPPKPAPLTPQEIAGGWLLLFDGETTFGLKPEGSVTVKDGALTVGGEKAGAVATTSAFGPGVIQIRYDYRGNQAGKLSGFGEEKALQAADAGALELRSSADAPSPLRISVPAGSTLTVRKLAYQPAAAKSLFNGKDLTGWKLFEGDAGKRKLASKFDVTPAGELHVVNGPGDLQTTTQHDDFLLQFECKTNGKLLNSGIFFRCLPDQYQNGYEAQVQNGYLGTDRTIPIDYGTGAIYRRVKSRKVVSDDFEWFTMTVLAQGKHIATWVNGYPTVDWTDDRPENVNARQGSKTGKGHLSIQGHDPTTDILFRNLRIVDWGAKK